MIEPLVLKSEGGLVGDVGGSRVITAAEIIGKFQLKSKNINKIRLSDQPLSSINNVKVSLNQSTKKPLQKHQIDDAFKKRISKAEKQKDKKLEEQPFNLRIGSKEMDKQNLQTNYREKIVKKVNEINKKVKKEQKLNIAVHQLIHSTQNICLTQRPKTPMSTKNRSYAFKMNINLQNNGSLTSRNSNDLNYFRKASDASTLSLKTKHTVSMNQLQDDNDSLFSRPQLSTMLENHCQSNILATLQEAKRKLYQQIYSLDKKLLNNYSQGQAQRQTTIKQTQQRAAKKTIVINLKKKQAKK